MMYVYACHRSYIYAWIDGQAPHFWVQGFLDSAQFGAFCAALDPNITDEQIETLLVVLDPHKSDRVTFSSCISALLPDRS